MNVGSLTEQSLQLLAQGIQNGDPDLINKAFTQATGLVWYDLERPAKILYPVITPLRNMIPRVGGRGGTAVHWKAITGINTQGMRGFVSEGNRGGAVTTSLKSYTAAYKGVGLEDYVTFEADYAAVNLDDAKARAVEGLLRSVMISEEGAILGGNASLALGTTPQPAGTAGTSGSLATASYNVYCVALSAEGYRFSSVSGGVPGQIVRTNTDGSSDTFGGGSAAPSTVRTVSVTGPSGSIACTVAPVQGAVAYAWFWGTAGNELLGAITTINSIVITATATGTQNVSTLSGDNSRNSLSFDGLLSLINGAGQGDGDSSSGSLINTQATGTAGTGTVLTAQNGGVAEIDADLKAFWDNYRLSPDIIIVNSQELTNITAKVIGGGGTPLFRFNMDAVQSGSVNPLTFTAGAVIGTYLNKFTMAGGSLVKVLLHPNCPPGTIIYYSTKIPYPLSNVANILQILTRRDYYQIEWPLKARKYEYGVYADEVLQCYFPPAFGTRTNIANG